jgi:hypothetical protein
LIRIGAPRCGSPNTVARCRDLRYPSDLTDAEWTLVGPLIPPAKTSGRPALPLNPNTWIGSKALEYLEARPGIEPGFTVLQTVAYPLRHLAAI